MAVRRRKTTRKKKAAPKRKARPLSASVKKTSLKYKCSRKQLTLKSLKFNKLKNFSTLERNSSCSHLSNSLKYFLFDY